RPPNSLTMRFRTERSWTCVSGSYVVITHRPRTFSTAMSASAILSRRPGHPRSARPSTPSTTMLGRSRRPSTPSAAIAPAVATSGIIVYRTLRRGAAAGGFSGSGRALRPTATDPRRRLPGCSWSVLGRRVDGDEEERRRAGIADVVARARADHDEGSRPRLVLVVAERHDRLALNDVDDLIGVVDLGRPGGRR